MFWDDPVESGGVLAKPGIYRIEIEGAGIYIGRYTHAYRPLREYRRNVAKINVRQDYRRKDPAGYRHVHRQLAAAVADGRRITFSIIDNADPDRLNERERYWLAQVPVDQRLNGPRNR